MIASEARVINVLLVEDDPGDVLMTREAFEEYLHNRLDVVSDGSEALAYLRREGEYADAPRPDLILLDLNLPRRDGREVLAEVKADVNLRTIPVIVLTTSQADEDVLKSYQLHANAYVTKPVDFDGFIEAIRQIDHFFVSVVQLPAGRRLSRPFRVGTGPTVGWPRDDRCSLRHRRPRRRHPRPPAALPRAGPQGRRVRAHPGDPRPPAHRRRAGDVLGDVERALLLQVVQGAPALLRRDHHRRDAGARCSPGIGENAGVVDIGDGWAVTFKVESHNHPSYVEPYQGAATGVGGIVRDIMAMGARPVAVMDQLRFGPADAPDTAPGAARRGRAASAATATRLGLPNIGGEVVFDAVLRGQPAGQRRCASGCCARRTCTWRSPPAPATRSSCSARAPGSTASAASRCWRQRDVRRRRGAAAGPQEAARRCRSATRSPRRCSSSAASSCSPPGLVVGIQDLGGAGLSCATSELASAGDGGMRVELDTRAAARHRHDARRDPLQRVAGADVRGRAPRTNVDAFLAVCAQVGRAGHRDRRGHRRRPAA